MNSKKLYPIVYGGNIPAKDYTSEESRYGDFERREAFQLSCEVVQSVLSPSFDNADP